VESYVGESAAGEVTVEVSARQITEEGSVGSTSTKTWIFMGDEVANTHWADLDLECPDDALACEATVEFELGLVGGTELLLDWTADGYLTGSLTNRETCSARDEPVNATVTVVQVE
jgi:hypothetical protein